MRLGLALFSASLFACVSDTPTSPDGGKQTGEEGGPCFSDGTCKTGLVCVVPNMCVKPDASSVDSGSMDAGTDTGSDGMAAGDADAGATCIGKTFAWWKGDGNANDHFNQYNLSIFGMPSYVVGQVGQAFDFTIAMSNPAHYTVSIPKLSQLTQMSIDFWIRMNNSPGAAATVLAYTDNVSAVLWSVSVAASSKNITFGIGNGQVSVTTTLGPFHHVVFVFDAGKLTPYFDGVAQTPASTTTTTIPMGGLDFAMGANADGTSQFLGALDEVALYSTALTPQDVQAIFNAGGAGMCRMQ
jgi:hypothetical protein